MMDATAFEAGSNNGYGNSATGFGGQTTFHQKVNQT
jgi:hypothetical protein